jgi:hypothetical protein
MTIDERIPALTDKELAQLQGNAVRLSQSGTAKQKADADRLMPLIDAELAGRRARAPAKAAAKRKKA